MIRDALLKIATGKTQQELQDNSAMGKSPIKVNKDASNLDKSVHALATKNATKRWGRTAALTLGYAKEGLQGLGQLAQRKSFKGVYGYDKDDIAANKVGADAAERELKRGKLSDIRMASK